MSSADSTSEPVVIGIAGGSGSGKTTVLNRIVDAVGPRRITVLDHDSYYHDLGHLSPEERKGFNVDHPNALESELLVHHLGELISGNAIHKPVYDYSEHIRLPEVQLIEPRPVIIIEGILVLAVPQLRQKMDIKLFVDTADDIRLIRRIKRDLSERGRTIENIIDQYERSVRPMHIEFVEPSKHFADIIIPRGGHNRVAIEMVLARIAVAIK
ncbi:MAG: uridine kinase [Rhodothermales bacterium]|nr:uridine kinase [Rhodothermales bacterium]